MSRRTLGNTRSPGALHATVMDKSNSQIISYAPSRRVQAADSIVQLLMDSGFAVWPDGRYLRTNYGFQRQAQEADRGVCCNCWRHRLEHVGFRKLVRRQILHARGAKGRPMNPIRFFVPRPYREICPARSQG